MEHLIYEKQEGIATVRLNRPEVHNAFNEVLIQELTDTFRAIDADDTLRLVVLEGEGKSFCAGADLHWMGKMKDYSMEQNIEDSRKLAEMFHTINACSKPVIGKVHGAAIGGGLGLVAVCDYVVAQMGTLFGLTEVQLGLVPAVISPFVIAKIGESNARAYFLSGSRFTAERAEHMHLIHETVMDEHAMGQFIQELVPKFLRAAPHAAKEAKRLIVDVLALQGDGDALIAHTSEVIATLRVSDEGQEGMDALLNKTKPSWNKG